MSTVKRSMPDTDAAIKPAAAYRIFWRWHFLAALIVIPFVLWQSTTGTLYLWSEWWMDVHYPNLRFVADAPSAARPSEQLAAALSFVGSGRGISDAPEQMLAGGGHHDQRLQDPAAFPIQELVLSDDPRRSTEVIMQGAHGLPYPVFVDPHSGRVLGRLTAAQWLPGLSRALHAGWPLGKPGNWLLELGNCWAIVMIVSGLYLWWPRGRSFWQALQPRLDAGARVLLRDLHAIVAVIFSGVFLFFLISALPWTAFWGGEVLSRVQSALDQKSPAGFSIGGATAAQMAAAGASIDAVAQAARDRDVTGAITIRLSPWRGAPLFVTNRVSSLQEDRTITADPATGAIEGDFRNNDLPIIPRLVAVGVHVHQGDFGPLNLWLNTLLAISLMWLSATGLASWWIRRPKGRLGVPPARDVRWSNGIVVPLGLMGLLLPIFGLSVVAIALIGWILKRPLRWRPA
jgi:uncharacterized iron-regulated membrane protein